MLSYKLLASSLFRCFSDHFKMYQLLLIVQLVDVVAQYSDKSIDWNSIKGAPLVVHFAATCIALLVFLVRHMRNKTALQWSVFLAFAYCATLLPLFVVLSSDTALEHRMNMLCDSFPITFASACCAYVFDWTRLPSSLKVVVVFFFVQKFGSWEVEHSGCNWKTVNLIVNLWARSTDCLTKLRSKRKDDKTEEWWPTSIFRSTDDQCYRSWFHDRHLVCFFRAPRTIATKFPFLLQGTFSTWQLSCWTSISMWNLSSTTPFR